MREEVQQAICGGVFVVFVVSLCGVIMSLLPGCAHIPADDCPMMPEPWPIFDATAERWEAYMGPLPDDYRVYPVMVEEVAEFEGCVHHGPGVLTGCTSATGTGWLIEVLECRDNQASILAHEYLHVLINITEGRPDHEHTHPAWGVVAEKRVEIE